MDIRAYLCREAEAITARSLQDIQTAEDWQRERPQRLARYYDQLGIQSHLDAPRTPLNITVTDVLQRDGYRIEKLYYESLPQLYVTGNLFIPDGLEQPAPAVAYFCGHSPVQKISFQSHMRKFVRLGFVGLIVDTIQYGEIKGDHHGAYMKGRFNWYSRGYTPAGVECWNGIRAIDLLSERSDVDPNRIGMTGISGGGGMSWWLAAADERVKISAPVCGTGTLGSHLQDRTLDGHCDCMFHINNAGWDLADVGALIAPRPVLVASAQRDQIYKIDSVRETVGKVERIYELLDAKENIQLVETPGAHSYHETSRTAIFSFFLKHLAGKTVAPEEVGDTIPDEDEPNGVLQVYTGMPPADERVTTIDENFVPRPQMLPLKTEAELKERRSTVIASLKDLTFGHFPKSPAPLNLDCHLPFEARNKSWLRFRFTSESEIQVPVLLKHADDKPSAKGTILALRSPGEVVRIEGDCESFLASASTDWNQAFVETRGVGELGWAEELQWHVRRGTGVLGRTIASLRTYDTLRALQALREMKDVATDKMAIAARGEMVVPALYAALLDGNISHLILSSPPPTHLDQGMSHGKGPALELLSCLRITDLPEVASLLWPAELIFIRKRPDAYQLTDETYRNIGLPGAIRKFQKLNQWQPD